MGECIVTKRSGIVGFHLLFIDVEADVKNSVDRILTSNAITYLKAP